MNERKKLLVVEDDPNLGQILKEYLEIKGFDAELCTDGEKGLTSYRKEKFDLCILDIMLPKKDGFSLAREIRIMDETTPIIFLTAKNLKLDTIEGFKIGGDDYITKPFSMEELILRLNAILKRTAPNLNGRENQKFTFGSFEFDYSQYLLSCKGKSWRLTSKEADLLMLLCQNMNKLLDRKLALKLIWHDDSYFNARSMDVYINKLRKYLKEDEQNVRIITVHGQGFKLVSIN